MTELEPAVFVPVPTAGVDPRVVLATAMHAAPGVYAVLVGSGMSTAAGIPTGWQVVEDLVRKVARAENVALETTGATPDEWWTAQGRPNLRYDTLLSALATTDAARQALLRRYFEPPTSEGGLIEPTPAHDALARLCASGRVRLVLTTNFDRLIERALDRQGVSPQVISSPASVRGMIPLVHAGVTVLKLHGDYATSGLRNTTEELASYPGEWESLLARVFDEYGLLVVGWSADYDVALAAALASAPSRRYPVFWTSFRGHLRESARRLVALRQAAVVTIDGADEFLTDLVARIDRLDRIAARRTRPTALRTYQHMPEPNPPLGWSALPLLQLRAAAEIGPATSQTTGVIRPEHRHRIRTALGDSVLTQRLREISEHRPANASVEMPAGEPDPLVDWEPTPDGYQTTDYATYRLGGDAARGVSALAVVRLPAQITGGYVLVTIDVAISLFDRVSMKEAAAILRDALVVATASLPEAIEAIVPPEAEANEAEVHFYASSNPGRQTRDNHLPARVDVSRMGLQSRKLRDFMGSAAIISGPLTERDAADLVVGAIELMLLANGFLDPRAGLEALREELGIASLGPSD